MRKDISINVITLGCSKNLVDSERIMGNLQHKGVKVFHDSELPSDIVLINTCGFILDAKEESIDMILRYAEARRKGEVKKLIVMGCLSQLYKEELVTEIPEVDHFFGVDQFEEIIHLLGADVYQDHQVRMLSTPSHYAYLKIAEGCNRYCSFCSIPFIRGRHVSRTIESIIGEAKNLSEKGVKELILISQDLSYYGIDIYGKAMLTALLKQLADVKGIEWIRCQYLYPSELPEELAETINAYPKICNYIDIPLQHINNRILNSMKRGVNKSETQSVIDHFRKTIDNVALRTSLIVGYPGETEKEFEELMEFADKTRFDRLGVFKYSEEEITAAAKLKDDVTEEKKQERADRIMQLQQKISFELNQERIGNVYKVLIDRIEGGYYIGRTEYDSPEIDNEVLIRKEDHKLMPGTFVKARIIDAEEFDLYAQIC